MRLIVEGSARARIATDVWGNSALTPSDTDLQQSRHHPTAASSWRGLAAQTARALLAAGASLLVCVGIMSAQEPKGPSAADPPQAPNSATDSQKPSTPKDEAAQATDEPKKDAGEKRPRLTPETLKGLRSQRQPPEAITKWNPLPLGPGDRPSAAELSKFNDFRQRGDHKDTDLPLIEKVIKYYVYSLTHQDTYDTPSGKPIRDFRDTLIQYLNTPQAPLHAKFQPVFKDTLRKFLGDVIAPDQNLTARINGILLLAHLRDDSAVEQFVEILQDPQQHYAVKYLAAKGIAMACQEQVRGEWVRRPLRVDLESKAVTGLLALLKDLEDTDAATRNVLRQRIVQALGAIGRVSSVVIQKDADVAVALLKIIRDSSIPRWDRNEAAVALAGLNIPPELDYNFQYVAHEIALFASEAAAAAIQDPVTDNLRTHLFLLDSYDALSGRDQRKDQKSLATLAREHPLASKKGDATYIRSLGEPHLKSVARAVLDIYQPSAKVEATKKPAANETLAEKATRIRTGLQKDKALAENLAKLNSLLQKSTPRSTQITPNAPDLGPSPALARLLKAAEAKAAEPKDNSKPASDGANGASSGRAPVKKS